MNIFVVGLPKSGRTTVAKAMADQLAAPYIDAMDWIRASFRDQKHAEHRHHYEDEYHHFLSIRRTINPQLVINYVQELLAATHASVHVIEAVSSPKDFAALFDYRHDMVIFLNRTDNNAEFKDHENIGISVMRDYCFWLASAGLIKKERWLEYNFQIPGEPSDMVKKMGSKNSVFIIKSIEQVIKHVLCRVSEQMENQCK